MTDSQTDVVTDDQAATATSEATTEDAPVLFPSVYGDIDAKTMELLLRLTTVRAELLKTMSKIEDYKHARLLRPDDAQIQLAIDALYTAAREYTKERNQLVLQLLILSYKGDDIGDAIGELGSILGKFVSDNFDLPVALEAIGIDPTLTKLITDAIGDLVGNAGSLFGKL